MSVNANESVRMVVSGHRRRRKFAAVMTGLVILILGIVIGAGSTILYLNRYYRPQWSGVKNISTRLSEELQKDYSLSPAQVEQVNLVIDRHLGDVQRIWQENRSRIQQAVTSMRDEVGGIIGPDKQAKWNEQVDRQCGRWMKPRQANRNHHGERDARTRADE